jgi:spermidine synthase
VKPWRLLAEAAAPGGGRLTLHARDTERVIRIDGVDLMSSRQHGSEEELARLGLQGVPDEAHVLIGGLGLGFTLRAALDRLGSRAHVEVAELAPAIVDWNRGELAEFAGRPLDDPRVTVVVDDVAKVIATRPSTFDAILLDVDNGPGALFDTNTHLYGAASLAKIHAALRPGGAVAVWSASESPAFTAALSRAGFAVEVARTRARVNKGAKHVLWLARRKPPRRGG